jgi:hypothetical protein
MGTAYTLPPASGTYQTFAPETHDAISLLQADHGHIEELFAELDASGSVQRKQELAARICRMLRVHRALEEEIFYPALLEVTEDEDSYDEALEAHAMASILIEDIEQSGPADLLFDAKLQILHDMLTLHVGEEEGPNGIFAEAAACDLDLDALGAEMQQRKEELVRGMLATD